MLKLKKFTTKSINTPPETGHNSAGKEKTTEQFDEFYNNQKQIIIKPHGGYSRWILIILVTIFFSFITIFTYDIFLKTEMPTNSEQQVIIERQEDITIIADERLTQLEEQINPIIVNFYLKPNDSSGSFYQDIYSFGSGFILTSDGWLVTTQSVMDKIDKENYIILTHNYEIYETEKIVYDPISPLVFIKIKATNLPVAKFGKITESFSGQNVFGFIASYPKAKNATLHLADLQASTLDDVVASTEEFSHFVSCREGYDVSLIGAPIINMAGEVIAIINNSQTAIPIDYFTKIINNLGKTGTIDRVYFGINYINLSKYPKIDTTSQEILDRGALLSGYKNLLAVEKLSPADKAGLQVGDIILMVEDETVNGHKTLTAIIQDYDSNKTLKLTILRDGKEKVIEIALEKL